MSTLCYTNYIVEQKDTALVKPIYSMTQLEHMENQGNICLTCAVQADRRMSGSNTTTMFFSWLGQHSDCIGGLSNLYTSYSLVQCYQTRRNDVTYLAIEPRRPLPSQNIPLSAQCPHWKHFVYLSKLPSTACVDTTP